MVYGIDQVFSFLSTEYFRSPVCDHFVYVHVYGSSSPTREWIHNHVFFQVFPFVTGLHDGVSCSFVQITELCVQKGAGFFHHEIGPDESFVDGKFMRALFVCIP